MRQYPGARSRCAESRGSVTGNQERNLQRGSVRALSDLQLPIASWPANTAAKSIIYVAIITARNAPGASGKSGPGTQSRSTITDVSQLWQPRALQCALLSQLRRESTLMLQGDPRGCPIGVKLGSGQSLGCRRDKGPQSGREGALCLSSSWAPPLRTGTRPPLPHFPLCLHREKPSR